MYSEMAALPKAWVVFTSLLILIIYLAEKSSRFYRKYRFPNPVPGLPILGNTFQMPNDGQGPYMKQLGDKYGEMFTMKFGSTHWVFLNSRRVATELLDKRAAIYSSRQNLAMAHDLISNGKRTLLMPYGDLWRAERKIVHQILNVSQKSIFEPYQDIESRALLYQYLHNPESWHIAHGRFSNSVIMSVVFGRRSKLDDSNLMALLKNAGEFVPYLMPGRALVDILPFLTKIPYLKSWQPWRWYGDSLYKRTARVFKKELDDVRTRQQQGTQKPCFLTEFLDTHKENALTEEELYFMTGSLMEAGSDTTRTSLNQAVAAAVLWPDWVDRVRKELDKVCGSHAERLPALSDMKDCPVVKGAVKETLRWKPAIAELGIPHALTKDDEFEGWRFPAGTVFTWNHWSISNTRTEYEQPERFWPERFIDDDLDKPAKGHLGFGAGRRLCVGSTVAVNNMFIALARLLYCFDLTADPDHPIDTSKPLLPVGEDAPFRIVIKPRSEKHCALIEAECQGAADI